MKKKRKENAVITILWSLFTAILVTAASVILMGILVARGTLPRSGASVYGGLAAILGSGIASAVCARNKSAMISVVTAVSYLLFLVVLHVMLLSGEVWRILPVLPCVVITALVVFMLRRQRKRRIRF